MMSRLIYCWLLIDGADLGLWALLAGGLEEVAQRVRLGAPGYKLPHPEKECWNYRRWRPSPS